VATGPKVIALKGGKDGRYCADESNNVICNRNGVGQWEKFTVVDRGAGKVALKGGKDGRYCADEGNLIKCNRNAIGQWETFTRGTTGGNIWLKGGKDGRYCADEGVTIKCNRNAVGGWEKFTEVCQSGCEEEAALLQVEQIKKKQESFETKMSKKFAATHAKLQAQETAMLAQIKAWGKKAAANGVSTMKKELTQTQATLKSWAKDNAPDFSKKCQMDPKLQAHLKKRTAPKIPSETAMLQALKIPNAHTEKHYFKYAVNKMHLKLLNTLREHFNQASRGLTKATRSVCSELFARGVHPAGMHRWRALMSKHERLRKGVSNNMKTDSAVVSLVTTPSIAPPSQGRANSFKMPAPKPEELLAATQKWLDDRLPILSQQLEWTAKSSVLNLETTMKEMDALRKK
jgi:hypothetical protein